MTIPFLDPKAAYLELQDELDDAYRRVIDPGEVALVLPNRQNLGMLWQAEAGMDFRMVGGFVNYLVSPARGLSRAVLAIDRPRPSLRDLEVFRAFLQRAGVGVILLDEHEQGGGAWLAGLRRAGFTGVRVADVEVFRVAASGPQGIR